MERMQNVGASLEAAVSGMELIDKVAVAVDMRGAIPEGRITYAASGKNVKQEIGVIYYARPGRLPRPYNFISEPFRIAHGKIVHHGSIHLKSTTAFRCSNGCGLRVELDRLEEKKARENGEFFCAACSSADKRYTLEFMECVSPAMDPAVVSALDAEVDDPKAHYSDLLSDFFGVFDQDPTGVWSPVTPLQQELVARLAAGGKWARPVSELVKVEGPMKGLIAIVGLGRPLSVGWINKANLQVDKNVLGYNRLYPVDYTRSKPEPRRRQNVADVLV